MGAGKSVGKPLGMPLGKPEGRVPVEVRKLLGAGPLWGGPCWPGPECNWRLSKGRPVGAGKSVGKPLEKPEGGGPVGVGEPLGAGPSGGGP